MGNCTTKPPEAPPPNSSLKSNVSEKSIKSFATNTEGLAIGFQKSEKFPKGSGDDQQQHAPSHNPSDPAIKQSSFYSQPQGARLVLDIDPNSDLVNKLKGGKLQREELERVKKNIEFEYLRQQKEEGKQKREEAMWERSQREEQRQKRVDSRKNTNNADDDPYQVPSLGEAIHIGSVVRCRGTDMIGTVEKDCGKQIVIRVAGRYDTMVVNREKLFVEQHVTPRSVRPSIRLPAAGDTSSV